MYYFTQIWAISAGCQLIKFDDYNSFAQTIGFDKDLDGHIDRVNKISGCVIIDRSFMDLSRVDLVNLYVHDGLSLISGTVNP